MDEAYYLADRVCVLHKGKIIAEGTPENLINRYGGGNTLIIRDCSAKAIDQLLKEIPDCSVDGSNVYAKLPRENGMKSIAQAVSIINTDEFTCEEFYVKKSTLEDVFLNLTGETLTDGGK